MSKITKKYYYGKNGTRKINCYCANIPKEVLQKSCIKEDDFIRVYAKDNKIIIEKETEK